MGSHHGVRHVRCACLPQGSLALVGFRGRCWSAEHPAHSGPQPDGMGRLPLHQAGACTTPCPSGTGCACTCLGSQAAKRGTSRRRARQMLSRQRRQHQGMPQHQDMPQRQGRQPPWLWTAKRTLRRLSSQQRWGSSSATWSRGLGSQQMRKCRGRSSSAGGRKCQSRGSLQTRSSFLASPAGSSSSRKGTSLQAVVRHQRQHQRAQETMRQRASQQRRAH